MAAGTYTTKYQAGGSGDNIVPDGYIKSVEKVWMDSYTFAFTSTNATIDIAVLPPNKKVVGIQVEIQNTVSHTSCTVSIGYSTDASVDTFLSATTLTHNATRTSICLPGLGVPNAGTATSTTLFVGAFNGFQHVTNGTQTTISVKLNNWVATSGTMKTIVRYT